MKLQKLFVLLAVGLVLVGTAGCKTRKPTTTALPGSGTAAGLDGSPGAGGRLGTGMEDPFTSTDDTGGFPAATFDPDQMNQDRAALASYTVYFGYDSSEISPSESSKLEAVAAALSADPAAKLLIEGHCDQRGTEEYNRSLGERRALSAREALATMGVDPARVATRSYGEDRPADPGQSESAYQMNRRDEFVLLHPR